MRYSCKAAVEYDLRLHFALRERYSEECRKRASLEGTCIKESNTDSKGNKYYQAKDANQTRYHYLGDSSHQLIPEVREYSYYKKALEIIDANINAMETLLSIYQRTSADSINELLSSAYRLPIQDALLVLEPEVEKWLKDNLAIKDQYPPYKPEGLIVTSFDGTLMRSRAECIHHEAFYIHNVPAIFELPYEIGGEVLHPDFTALDVFTMQPKIFEHLGNWFHTNLVKRTHYRTDSLNRCDMFKEIGFLPESNLLLTFGADENHFDAQAIHRKISMLAVPPPSQETMDMLKRL